LQGSTSGAANGVITYESATFGMASSTQSFTYHAAGGITLLSVLSGPLAGNTTLTITGTNLAADVSDVESVTVAGVAVARIVSAATGSVVVSTGVAGATTTGAVVIKSMQYGTTTSTAMFTYNPMPMITSFWPMSAPANGSTTITIYGSNLDLTNAMFTIAGVMPASVSGNSSVVTLSTV
jgi:hypothetical protein